MRGDHNTTRTPAHIVICDFYGVQFHRFHYGTSFAYVCKQALKAIRKAGLVESHGYAFDYVLFDESQDFPIEFITLCEVVTKKHVFVAGDIFQSIFDDMTSGVKPDYLLSKCYRTDPRTLMFSHALGLGLFENPKIKWLKDDEWDACGYKIEKENNQYKFTREL
jgi:superfamily I DNA and RNA helicase